MSLVCLSKHYVGYTGDGAVKSAASVTTLVFVLVFLLKLLLKKVSIIYYSHHPVFRSPCLSMALLKKKKKKRPWPHLVV